MYTEKHKNSNMYINYLVLSIVLLASQWCDNVTYKTYCIFLLRQSSRFALFCFCFLWQLYLFYSIFLIKEDELYMALMPI